jgi:hypothetical protein
VAVAVFDNMPVAAGLTVPVITYVTVLPPGSSTVVSSMLPEPLAEKPVAPPVGVAVQVSPVKTLVSVESAIVTSLTIPSLTLVTTTV